MILNIGDVTASGSDGAHLLPVIERAEADTEVLVERVIADGAFGSGEKRAACVNYDPHPIDLVSPVAQPRDPAVDKSAFRSMRPRRDLTPGHTVVGQTHRQKGQPFLQFTFSG